MARAAAGDLRERVAVLELTSTADKSAYTWSEARRIWADALYGADIRLPQPC